MNHTLSHHFHHYARTAHTLVEGWVDPGIFETLALCDAMHHHKAVQGGALEIGVHHGRFFIALHNLLRASERSFAIDLFEQQSFNIDGSGSGHQATFQANLSRLAANPEKAAILSADSTLLGVTGLGALTGGQRCRLISIDGSHTADATANDIFLAQQIVTPFAAVFVDDYMNPHWPGVHEGVARYFHFLPHTLAPALMYCNKLVLTPVSSHGAFLDFFRAAIEPARPALKVVRLYGYDVLTLRADQAHTDALLDRYR